MNTGINPFTEARAAFHATYLDLTVQGVEFEERIKAALDAYDGMLLQLGLLTLPGDEDHLDSLAKDLAKASAFVLYTIGDGWRKLRTSQAHIDVALRKALARPGADATTLRAIAEELQHAITERGGV